MAALLELLKSPLRLAQLLCLGVRYAKSVEDQVRTSARNAWLNGVARERNPYASRKVLLTEGAHYFEKDVTNPLMASWWDDEYVKARDEVLQVEQASAVETSS